MQRVFVQSKPSPKGDAPSTGVLQRRESGQKQPAAAPPIVHDVLRSPGQPLDAATRAFMEPRFEHDFSKVRIYADERAANAAASIDARAFTSNQSVVFGAGQYAPQTTAGRLLLSHELAHVVQQQGGVHLQTEIGETGDPYEMHADALADRVARDQPVSDLLSRAAGAAPTSIQRKIVDQKKREIKIDLAGLKPGDSVTPIFPHGASKRVQRDTTEIVNAMLKTPSGFAAVQTWIAMPGSIQLRHGKAFDESGKEVHGSSLGADPNFTAGVTKVTTSSAVLKNDRYSHLTGEQLLGAVGTHESGHQRKDNLLIKTQKDSLQDAMDAEETAPSKQDLAKEETLKHEVDIVPVQLELTSLIEYDVLYPDKAGPWLTKNFEKFLGKAIYEETVRSAIDGLLSRGYLDAPQKSQVLDVYLHHHKKPAGKKAP
jgi:hypothetical protein